MRRGILCGLLTLMLIIVSCSTEELMDPNEETVDLIEEDVDDDNDTEDENDTEDDTEEDVSDDNEDQNEEDVEDDVEDDNEEGNENEGTDVLTISEEILELVNQHRVSIGKLALIRSSVADEIATEHSNYMISRGAISHDNFSDRFQELRQLVNANSAGENVAAGYPTAATVMQGWINSPGHKANIEGNFTHIGIAAVKDSQGRYYYTQLFYR